MLGALDINGRDLRSALACQRVKRVRWPSTAVDASMGRMPNDDISPAGISARLISSSADSADPPGINDYDSFAEVYSAENEVNLHNAYYERPATLALAGDVAGRRILDVGCGSGPLSAALRDRGAIVSGLLPDFLKDKPPGSGFLCFLFFVLQVG
jgi:hypothetical protein